MCYQGRRSWPPAWSGPSGPNDPLPTGEVGVLIKVEAESKYLTAPHCLLVIGWNDEEYFGALFFDDESFAHAICDLLSNHLGSPMSILGSLDIP
jgi:hypothetical protein